MAGQNLSPRQKMIGMMYLVLTALLALNVSKEIINAFVTVNDSLEISNENTSKRNDRIYSDFQKAMQNDPTKVGPFNDKAQKVKKLSADMNAYIAGLKAEMTRKVEKIEDPNAKTPEAREIARKDDYDIPTTMMCGDSNDGVGHKATEFKNKLNEFKASLAKILGPEDAKSFGPRVDQLLNTKDPAPEMVSDNKRTWEMANFYHNPVVAQLALFTKYQADVRNVESEVINHLYTSIDAGSFKFDQLEARVIAPTSYVLTNQEYKADIFLAAFSSTSNPEIFIGGSPIKVENGMGKYSTRPGSEGEKKYGGVIKVKDPATNEMKEYKFESSYIAAKPASVVSADKMNVLYIGVENPMSISVPGVADANVTATVSGGGVTLSRDAKSGSSKYIAKATTQGEASINVAAKLDGKSVPMGTFKYRVKRVPDPVAMIGGKKGGPINKAELAAQTSVNSIMENFDFELYFKVKSFRMTLIRKGKDPTELESTSNLITPQMKAAIQSAGPGAKVYFEYIKASGPDGTTRSLSSVNFVLQ
jgi:gliding motility-associated protein GldM